MLNIKNIYELDNMLLINNINNYHKFNNIKNINNYNPIQHKLHIKYTNNIDILTITHYYFHIYLNHVTSYTKYGINMLYTLLISLINNFNHIYDKFVINTIKYFGYRTIRQIWKILSLYVDIFRCGNYSSNIQRGSNFPNRIYDRSR